MDLSIVIPAYNEADKIADDIRAAALFMEGRGLTGEIVVVDDGSTDGTADIAAETDVPSSTVHRRVLRYAANRGKGCAVRTGMRRTRGRLIMFADSGGCIPFDNAKDGLHLIETGACDIAHGSRRHPKSDIRRSHQWHRQLLSRCFRMTLPLFVPAARGLTDTQCGFKLYRGDAGRELFAGARLDGFLFDLEIIVRARHRGLRIREFPVNWTSDHDSRMQPLMHAPGILGELFALRRPQPDAAADPETEERTAP